ncbi:MAG: NOG1 family protein [Candidatus Geothermarchaeales archaeon]
MNPYERVKGLPETEEIIDQVLRKASRTAIKIPFLGKRERTAKARERKRIETLAKALTDYLKRAVEIGETHESAEIFYNKIGDLLFGTEEIRESTRRLRGSIRIIEKIRKTYLKRLRRNVKDAARVRREAYGRSISVLRRRRKDLERLRSVWEKMRGLPSIDRVVPTVVVAGSPNVGKSSLVNALSRVKIEVASYPFTTKEISVGHLERGSRRVQIIDTPGLLDRPMEKRNPIERKTVLCLRHVANLIVYMFDPSHEKYYPLEDQIKIYGEIRDTFAGIPVIPVVNKIDIAIENLNSVKDVLAEEVFETSITEEVGLEGLLNEIFNILYHVNK